MQQAHKDTVEYLRRFPFQPVILDSLESLLAFAGTKCPLPVICYLQVIRNNHVFSRRYYV